MAEQKVKIKMRPAVAKKLGHENWIEGGVKYDPGTEVEVSHMRACRLLKEYGEDKNGLFEVTSGKASAKDADRKTEPAPETEDAESMDE